MAMYDRAGKIQISCSAKGVVKLRKTINERPTAITHETDIVSLYDVFFQREN